MKVNTLHVYQQLEPQLKEHIQELFTEGWTLECIQRDLSNPYRWTEGRMYEKEVFNFNKARFTLQQLCNTVELLTTYDIVFMDELRPKILSLAEYEWEVRMTEMQEQETFEHNKSIERRDVA